MLQFDRWSLHKPQRTMFKYFIESIESENQQMEVNNHRSETMLLASSRSHSNHQQYYQHSHMLREDYQGLFYRKLNAIIQLQSLQQVLEQNEGILGQLSSNCLTQIIAKRDIKSLENSQFKKENECGVVMMAKEMVLLHNKVRRQWNLLRKKAELEHQVAKMTIDKRSLVEQIKIFGNKLNQVLLENFNQHSCSEVERVLLDHARKYNLSKVISNFMDELKSTIIGSLINQMIGSLLKNSSQDIKSSIKIEQLKLFANAYKNRKEMVNNLTLYLKQFYSSNIYKEFSEIINRLTKEYEVAKLKSNFITKKLTDQIDNNVKLLRRVFRQITTKSGEIMDYKIDIAILTEEIKLIEKNLCIAEQSMAQYINKQTEMLLTEYLIHQGKLFRQDITTEKLTEMPDYKYFNEQLTTKYKQFLVEHLRKAEEIQKMKEKIEQYNLILASYEKQLKILPTPEQSQVHTYRALHDHNDRRQRVKGGLMSKVSCQDEVFEEQSEEESPQKSNNHQTVFDQVQGNSSLDKQNRQRNLECGQLPLKEVDYNNYSPERQAKKKQYERYESCGEMALKMTALLNQCQRKQKFLVQKVVKIGCKIIDLTNLFKKNKNNREYEAKLTKKYLILQPINQQTLSICEKIEWNRIKKYTPNYHMATLILEYSGCRVLLNFITFNMDIFVKRLEKVYSQLKL